jgi:hypothetical protein
MKKLLLIIIIVLFYQTLASAQKEGLASIKKENLKAHMEFFSSDQLKGREMGTDANEIAALYIKTNIRRLGLKPAGNDYFQYMPMKSSKSLMEESFVKISNNKGEIIYSTDSVLQLMTGGKTLEEEGKIVFAGYGYEDEKSGYSDFKDIDIKDKIVMFMTRTPEAAKSAGEDMNLNFMVENKKISYVLQKEAKAILFVFDPLNKLKDPFHSVYYDYSENSRISFANDTVQPLPFIFELIKSDLANRILSPTGKSLSQYQEEIYNSGKPVSVEIPGITLSLKSAVKSKEFNGKNVIGIIEGSDPVLKNECIVYTAHFDHVGEKKDGAVFNGADDNATGSMALIEIAQAFMNLKKKPLRTVIFAWVNGEEKGLLGSEYYVNNPVMPLEKTLLDINLDMIGRSKTPADTGKFYGIDLDVTQPGEVILYTKHESSELMKTLSSAAVTTGIKVIDKGEDIEAGGSDHESFWAKGVTALMFHTGIHKDVHEITDDEAKIDYDKMEQVTKLVFLLGYEVANQRQRFKVDKPLNK